MWRTCSRAGSRIRRQPEICFYELFLGRLALPLASLDDLMGAPEIRGAPSPVPVQLPEVLHQLSQRRAEFIPELGRPGSHTLLQPPLNLRDLTLYRFVLLERPTDQVHDSALELPIAFNFERSSPREIGNCMMLPARPFIEFLRGIYDSEC